jgi:hypothetical protein
MTSVIDRLISVLIFRAAGPKALPSRVPESVVRVWDGFTLLVACRWARFPGEPVVFAKEFAARWCGITESSAFRGKGWLIERGFLQKVGETTVSGRRTSLWLPATLGGGKSRTRRDGHG